MKVDWAGAVLCGRDLYDLQPTDQAKQRMKQFQELPGAPQLSYVYPKTGLSRSRSQPGPKLKTTEK